MRVFASVNLDRKEGSVAAVLPTELVGAVPAEVADSRAGEDSGPGPVGPVVAQLVDARGEVLDERTVPFVRSSCEDPDEDVTGTVDAVLPDVEGAATVRLLVAGQVVAEHRVGGPVAAPSEPSVAGGDRGPGGEPDVIRLRWRATGASEAQRYVVQVSTQQGDWETVAVDLAQPSLDLPAGRFDADELRVRVLATTGTGTVEVRDVQVRIR